MIFCSELQSHQIHWMWSQQLHWLGGKHSGKSDEALRLPVQAGLAASATHSGSPAELSTPSAAAAWPCLAIPSCTPWPSFSLYRYGLCLQVLGHVCIFQADIKDTEQKYTPLRSRSVNQIAIVDQLAIAGEKMLLHSPTALQQPRVAHFPDIYSTAVAHNWFLHLSLCSQEAAVSQAKSQAGS